MAWLTRRPPPDDNTDLVPDTVKKMQVVQRRHRPSKKARIEDADISDAEDSGDDSTQEAVDHSASGRTAAATPLVPTEAQGNTHKSNA